MTSIGKVVKKVDQYSVVVNLGSEDEISEDMEFVIYEEGEEIKDPDTGDSLGVLEIPKARVKPTHIMEKMSVMESSETELKSYSSPLDVFNTQRTKEVQKELPVEDVPNNDEHEEVVQVGDLVKKYDPNESSNVSERTDS